MIRTVREFGIIPFFSCGVPGWSIEELTAPDFWFYSSDQLGPWDWKIEVVREGDIAYGKFLSGKAAFATRDIYRHLMNWRRSLPKYRVALGEDRWPKAKKNGAEASIYAPTFIKRKPETNSEKLLRIISPIALAAIREHGALESKELRHICGEALTDSQLNEFDNKYKSILKPAVKKNVMDSVLQFLEMGTWTVIGDMTRLYRGANLEYDGWQRSSFTTPDALFNTSRQAEDAPFWEKFIEGEDRDNDSIDCTPEESQEYLIEHVGRMFPDHIFDIARML